MINDYTGIKNIEIGGIDIGKTFSFIEVDSSYTKEILAAFKDKHFKKREINIEVANTERRDNQSNRRSRKGGGGGNQPPWRQGRKSDRSKKANRRSR